jgi:hypothetical protein
MARHSGWSRALSRRALLAGLGAAVLGLACDGDDPAAPAAETPGSGAPRPFRLGLSSVPAEASAAGYREAFRLAGTAGETVLIQRAPPWSEFLAGATISERTEDLTRLEVALAAEHGLAVFLAIDPTDPTDRGRLASPPSVLEGAYFADLAARQAFIAYAKYLALNYEPAYLALGVEVNMILSRRDDGAFRNFQSLYFETYDAVKELSPATLVFPTFQYEELLGLLAGESGRPATWGLVARFEPKMDMLAVTSFPGFVFGSVDDLPADYYQRLAGRSERPLALASVGWTSGTTGALTAAAAEVAQATYLGRLLSAAVELPASLVVWYLGRDPAGAAAAGFDRLATAGLYDAAGEPKTSWGVWRGYAERPLEPA